MVTPVIVPKLGMTMEEATVIRWLKAEGDRVEKDEPLLEIMTEKVDMQVEAPASGVLRGIRVKPGDVVPVTQVIALILAEGEELPASIGLLAVPLPAAEAAGGASRAGTVGGAPPSLPAEALARATGEVVPAVPAARRLAHEAGIDLRTIVGSGPAGRITEADVARALPDRAAARRRTMAGRMAQSTREIPHVYLFRSVDMTGAAAARGEASYTAVVVWAAARALRSHPLMRATLDGEMVVVRGAVHIAVAVDTPAGLVVPVVRDADRMELPALHREIERLASRARDDALTLDDVTGATFTVSNLGMFGVDAFTALINPPQSAILAVGGVSQRPWAVGEAVMVRPVCDLVLGIDHRVADGAAGARFLHDLCRALAAMAP